MVRLAATFCIQDLKASVAIEATSNADDPFAIAIDPRTSSFCLRAHVAPHLFNVVVTFSRANAPAVRSNALIGTDKIFRLHEALESPSERVDAVDVHAKLPKTPLKIHNIE